MRPDADDLAALVQASQFQLIGSSGQVVAELGPALAPPNGYQLQMLHHAPTVTDSALRWTDYDVLPGAINRVRLQGPSMTGTGQNATLDLESWTGGTHPSYASLYISSGSRSAGIFCSVDDTAGDVDLGPSQPGGALRINGRQARLLTDIQEKFGGGTGNVAGVSGPTLIPGSGLTVAVESGDKVLISGSVFMSCAAAGASAYAEIYIAGAAQGRVAWYSASGAGDTVMLAIEPQVFTASTTGNLAIDLRFTVFAGGTYGCQRTMLVAQVFAAR